MANIITVRDNHLTCKGVHVVQYGDTQKELMSLLQRGYQLTYYSENPPEQGKLTVSQPNPEDDSRTNGVNPCGHLELRLSLSSDQIPADLTDYYNLLYPPDFNGPRGTADAYSAEVRPILQNILNAYTALLREEELNTPENSPDTTTDPNNWADGPSYPVNWPESTNTTPQMYKLVLVDGEPLKLVPVDNTADTTVTDETSPDTIVTVEQEGATIIQNHLYPGVKIHMVQYGETQEYLESLQDEGYLLGYNKDNPPEEGKLTISKPNPEEFSNGTIHIAPAGSPVVFLNLVDSELWSESKLSSVASLLTLEYSKFSLDFVTERPAEGDYYTLCIGSAQALQDYATSQGLVYDSENPNASPGIGFAVVEKKEHSAFSPTLIDMFDEVAVETDVLRSIGDQLSALLADECPGIADYSPVTLFSDTVNTTETDTTDPNNWADGPSYPVNPETKDRINGEDIVVTIIDYHHGRMLGDMDPPGRESTPPDVTTIEDLTPEDIVLIPVSNDFLQKLEEAKSIRQRLAERSKPVAFVSTLDAETEAVKSVQVACADTDGWRTIGTLNNPDGINWKYQAGNLTGSGAPSVVWHAQELGALGVWTDGTDNWTGIAGWFDANWTMLGCGDFDGDGKDSVLMSLSGGLFYSVDLDGTLTSLGASNWSGWEFGALGDFAGDGKDDIVLFNKGLNCVVLLADGNADAWTSLGQIDSSDWAIAGAGDFNSDGIDDLLVRQTSTGIAGAYAGGDMNRWSVIDTTGEYYLA